MKPFRVELVATDGEIQRSILFVSFTKNGVYSGFCSEDKLMKKTYNTYHLDGNFFLHMSGQKPRKIGQFPRLDDLKDKVQLLSVAFTSDIRRLHSIPYRFKKLDAIVTIDIRNFNGHIGCSVLLVEPNNYLALGNAGKIGFPSSGVELHSFLHCTPWLALMIYGQKSENSAKLPDTHHIESLER